MEKLNRLRYTMEDDIILLRQVITNNPYEDTRRWKLIQHNVYMYTHKNFSTRAIRDHVEHLIKLYIKNDLHNLKK